jgi:hypothetical protein
MLTEDEARHWAAWVASCQHVEHLTHSTNLYVSLTMDERTILAVERERTEMVAENERLRGIETAVREMLALYNGGEPAKDAQTHEEFCAKWDAYGQAWERMEAALNLEAARRRQASEQKGEDQ